MTEDDCCPPHCCCCGPGEPCCDCGEIMPTPEDRTAAWAIRFREAAAAMPAEAPEDIDPIIWEAQRQAYLAQAEELESEVKP